VPYSGVPYNAAGMPYSAVPYSPAPGVVPYVPVPPVVVVQGPPTSGLAVASLVLSILGLVSGCCSFGIFSILAVIFGHAAMGETRNGRKSGQGMAVAGLVMGYIVLIPAILLSIWMFFGAGMAAISGGTSTTP
jgi:Domain of unknown function (DUF4190)